MLGQRRTPVATAPPRRTPGAVAAIAAAQRSAADTSELAAMVAQKEAQLRALFEPGKLQPKAAVVASLRREIAAT